MTENKVRLVKGPMPVGFKGRITPKCDLLRAIGVGNSTEDAVAQAEGLLCKVASEEGANMVVYVDYDMGTAGNNLLVLISGQGVIADEPLGQGRIGFSAEVSAASQS